MSRYSFYIDEITRLIPAAIRKIGVTSIVTSILCPLIIVYDSFVLFMEQKTFRLKHTGQVYSLEKVIGNYCNNYGCYITDGEYIKETMVPYDGTGNLANYQIDVPYGMDIKPQLCVAYAGFGQISQDDFIVHLPKELYGNVDETGLCSLIDAYKLAGKTYGIVYDGINVERYDFGWSDEVCVQTEDIVEQYNFKWSEPICVQSDI